MTTPTPHAELVVTGDPALDAQTYAVGETGQLNKANDDKATGFHVIQTCEARDEEIRRRQGSRLWPG